MQEEILFLDISTDGDSDDEDKLVKMTPAHDQLSVNTKETKRLHQMLPLLAMMKAQGIPSIASTQRNLDVRKSVCMGQ